LTFPAPDVTTEYTIGAFFLVPLLSTTQQVTIEVVLCVYGSSQILLEGGKTIAIKEIKNGDMILDATGKLVTVEKVVKCWLGPNYSEKGESQLVIVFEKDSLAPGVPTSTFAIDPKHPIATPTEYSKNGSVALKPANQFVKSDGTIKQINWDQIADMLPGENARYDLVLSKESCGAYIANGIVVKSRESYLTPGYEYF
jgi:hypothetical protein